MEKILALLPEQPTRINATIVFIISAIALTMAAFGHYERQQLLGVAHDTAQMTLPNLMNKQITVRNLELLRHYGDAVASDPHPMDRRRALNAARLLVSHPSLADDHQVAPLVVEAEAHLAHLARLAVTESDRDAAVLRWEKLSNRLGEAADRIAVEATQEVASESERITELANQSRSRLLVILGAMALLMSLTLHLRRRQSATEASLDHAKLAHRWLEGENAMLRLAADHTADTMILVHSTDADEGLKLIYANAAFARHIGYSRQETTTLAVKDITDSSTDDLAEQMAALKNAGTQHFETEHIVRDGRRVPVEVSLNWIDHHGEPLAVGYCRDITARRAAEARLRALEVEAALRLHERRYKEFFDAFSDGILMLDVAVDGRCPIAALNPAAERLMGFTGAEARGKCADELFPAETAGFLMAQDRCCIDSGAPVHYEVRLDGPGGRRIHENTMVPLRDAAGRIHRIAGIIRDITERVRMEQQLRDAAAQMRAFLDNIPDPAWIKDMDNRYLAVNMAFVRQSGAAAPADVIGRLDLDFLPVNAARANLAYDMQVSASGCPLRTEESGADRDGHESWFETIRGPMRDGESNIVGTVGISRDISSRVRAQSQLEERERVFRSLAENIPGNIARYSPDARFVYINPELGRTFGCSLDDMVGKTPMECYPDGRFADYQKRVLTVAGSGYDSEMEMIVLMPDGTRQTHHIRFVAERDPKGCVVGVIAFGTDITARRRMQDAIKAREREFRMLAENMPDNVVRYDRQCRVQYMNPAMVKGVAPEALPVLGETPAETSPGIDAVADYQHLLERVMATGVTAEMEIPTPHPGGEIRTHHVRIVAERDESGEIVGALTLGQDITERRRLEDELRRTLRFRQLLLDELNSVGMSLMVLERGKVIYNNDSHFGRRLGYAAGELGEAPGFLDLIHPDDRPRVADISRRRLAGEAVPISYEVGALAPDGSRREYEFFVTLIPDTDPPQTLVLAHDIAERKRYAQSLLARAGLEQRQSQFFDLAPGYFYTLVHRPDGGYAMPFASASIVDLFGIGPEDVAQDVSALAAMSHPDDVEMTFDKTEQSERDLTPYHVEYRINHPHKGLRWIEARSLPQRDPDGGTRWHGFMHDITERVAGEQSLKKLNANWAATLEALPDMLCETDLDGICHQVWVQPPGLLARHRKAMLGRSFAEHLPPEAAEVVMSSLREANETGSSYGKELRRSHAVDARWFELSVSRKAGDPADGPRFIILFRVITERKRLEADLMRREEEFRALAENSPDLIFRYDREGCRIYANKAVLALTQLPSDALIGWPPTDGRIVSPKEAEKSIRSIRHVVETGGPTECAVEFVAPEGRHYVFGNHYVPEFGPDGEVASVLCISRDVTAFKQALESLRIKERSLADAQRIGVMGSWELDLVNGELLWSDEMLRIFEIDSARLAAGPAQFLEATHPDDRDKVRAARSEALKSRTSYDFDHRLLFADGRIKHVRERCETDYDAAGRPSRSCGTVQDITAIKETERELNESRDRVRELAAGIEATRESERKHLAREIHDELGQVLSALRMNVSMLRVKHGNARPAMVEAVQNIMVLVDRTIQTVRNLTSRLRPAALDMGVVPALEWLLSEFRTHSGLHCELRAKEDAIVLDDEHATAVFRIVQEALTNVARHAEARRIEVALTHSDGELALMVRDDGKGFDPELRPVNSYGLVGMRERAEMMGGRLKLESAPKQGTTIELRIPAGNRP
ncbi:MAG: PAS domain-containing protein [Sulfuritalea sp.]|nr:PAS domain-containing protein [Sulfuritalea sp.]